jgi:hypothetical protein
MRTFGAFALLTGIGVGLFLYRPGPIGHDALREDVQRRDNESNQSCAASALSGRDRSFAPQLSLANLQATKKEHAKTPPSSIDHARQSTIAARALTPETRMTVTGWQPIVTNTAGMIKSGSAAATLRPKDATSRYKLVVKLQRNLKKRGCYWGRIDGSWGTGSKYAMQAFIDRINAALPIDEPDYLLLTMLQANTDKMCGGCPVGQTTTFPLTHRLSRAAAVVASPKCSLGSGQAHLNQRGNRCCGRLAKPSSQLHRCQDTWQSVDKSNCRHLGLRTIVCAATSPRQSLKIQNAPAFHGQP